jgi:ComF family protein
MIEHIIGLIAPHTCLGCGKEGSLLCAECRELPPIQQMRCSQCGRRKCSACLAPAEHLYVVTIYDGLAKELIHQLKFGRARAAADAIAVLMHERLPDFAPGTVITFVPTAPKRVRVRGYDQAARIAKRLAALRGLQSAPLLTRVNNDRQVGRDRGVRREQARNAFAANDAAPTPRRVLLIDDVITTGATAQSAAQTLHTAGATHVTVAAFAAAERFG